MILPPLIPWRFFLPLVAATLLLLLPANGQHPVAQPAPPPAPIAKPIQLPPPVHVPVKIVPNIPPVPSNLQYRQPADAVLLAYRDVQRLPEEMRPYIRYIEPWEQDPKLKWYRWVAVSGLINALSLSQRIVPADIILESGEARHWKAMQPADWGNVALFRICLADYNQTPEIFDRLGDPNLNPRYRTFSAVYYKSWVNEKGQTWPAGEYRTAVDAPWLFEPLGLPEEGVQGSEPARSRAMAMYEEAVYGLRGLTHSKVPIVEARNFVWQTGVNFNRPAGYNSWLRIKFLDDWDKLIRRDPNNRVVLRDGVSDSLVSQESREIEREGRGDGRWITRDQVDHRAQGDRNPLLIAKRGALKFDGVEGFGRMDNNWWAVVAAKNDGIKGGTLLDSAPDGIGGNQGILGSNDFKIHTGIVCFGCHDMIAGRGGLQPFKAYNRIKFSVPGKLGAVFERKREEEEYLTPFDPLADTDRRAYIGAVLQATGQEPHIWAAAVLDAYKSFDRPLTVDDAAAELGIRPEAFLSLLDQYITTWGAMPDGINDSWMKPKEQRQKITRSSWNEFFPFAQIVVRGLPVYFKWQPHKKP